MKISYALHLFNYLLGGYIDLGIFFFLLMNLINNGFITRNVTD
jgi:hypothetical protein